jgi:hypothetical protein
MSVTDPARTVLIARSRAAGMSYQQIAQLTDRPNSYIAPVQRVRMVNRLIDEPSTRVLSHADLAQMDDLQILEAYGALPPRL